MLCKRAVKKGYEQFKIGVTLREAETADLTQDELAMRLRTKKTAISRIENHAEDIKLSTLERFAAALGKKLTVSISAEYADRVAEARADYKSGRVKRRKSRVAWDRLKIFILLE